MQEINTTTRPPGNELSAYELDQVSGGGLSFIIIPFVPPPPGPPIVLHRGPVGH